MNWQITTQPTEEPITLAEAKLHLRVDGTADDTLITAMIKSARQWCEDYERRSYVTQTITAKFDKFCNQMVLPRPKLVSVTSVKYIDTAGDQQTLDPSYYVVDTFREPGQITLAYGESWPSIRDYINVVEIIFVGGYGAAAAVPERVKCAIKLLLGHLYENREATCEKSLQEIPLGVKSLLNSRVWLA